MSCNAFPSAPRLLGSSAPSCHLSLFTCHFRAPQPRAAAHAVFVRDDLNVRLKLKFELVGIAAADVEPVKIRHDAQILNGALHTAVPTLLADLLARRVADLLVVILTLAKRDM